MITLQKLIESYLTCALCSEELYDPGTLDCNHTLCKPCILGYAKKQPEVQESNSLPCPVCKQPTRVPSLDKPLQDWVNHVKTNHITIDLQQTLGSATKNAKTCCVCHAGRETTPITAWCSTCSSAFCSNCESYHRRMPLSRNHDVVFYDAQTTENIKTLKCPQHEDENIYQFCVDCISALCLKCKALHHQKCKNVLIIEDTVPENSELHDRIIGDVIGETGGYVSLRASADDDSEIGVRIQSACREAVMSIKNKEKEIIKEICDIRGEQSKLLESRMDSNESDINGLEDKVKVIEEAFTSGCANSMFNLYASSDYDENDLESEKSASYKIEDIKVPRIKPVWKDFRRIITEINLCETIPMAGNPSNRNAVLHDFLDVKHSQDARDPRLVDLVVVDFGVKKRVIVTDQENRNIKMVFKDGNKQFLTTVSLDNPPFGVTIYNDSRVLVTVPSSRNIFEFLVYPHLSKTSRVIRTKHKYHGITYLKDDKLAVSNIHTSFVQSATVDVININGDVLLSIKSRCIQDPNFLCSLHDGKILVSNTKGGSVSLYSEKQRKCIFNYKAKRSKGKTPAGRVLVSPRGVTANIKDDYFVVDGHTNKVVQLQRSGDFSRVLLSAADGLEGPSGICTCEENDLEEYIFVTSQRYVKVFKLK